MQVGWGIIGCGDIVRKRVARAILDDEGSWLAAMCRRNKAKLHEFCQEFGVEKGYAEDTELLKDPDIQAVYIATPVRLHLPQTLAAAAAGKHVLVEKPMARTVAECEQMIAACRDRGVKLGVAYYRRFYPVIERIKALIQSGQIGQPLSIGAATSTPHAFTPKDEGYWRLVPDEGGGGALMDIGSHRLNLFLDLFGEPAEVKAFCGTLAGSYQAEDCASLLLRFQCGVQGSLQCLFGTGVEADEFSVTGTRGRLAVNPLNGGELVITTPQETRKESLPPHQNLHAPLLADFSAAVCDDRPPRVDGEEGRRTNVVMALAYQSAAVVTSVS